MFNYSVRAEQSVNFGGKNETAREITEEMRSAFFFRSLHHSKEFTHSLLN